MTNTFKKGSVKVLVYQERSTNIWYASALEFNLTFDGNDKKSVLSELQLAISDYITSAREIGDESLLNQEPDPELLALWEADIHQEISEEATPSPYITAFAGVENLSFA
jgi:hypothetical protein